MSKQAKAADMREKSQNDLLNRERDLHQQLFKLRFQKATGGGENPSKIRQVRREIARIKTVLVEKKKSASGESKPAAVSEKKKTAAPAKKPAVRRKKAVARSQKSEGR
jgi:large subunit ribosomal protein L29